MKINPVFLIVGAGVLVAMVVFAITKLGNKKTKHEKLVINELISQEWVGSGISMPGLECSVISKFGSNIKLHFNKNGTCLLEVRDKVIKAKWKMKKEQIFISGGKINTELYYSLHPLSKTLNYFELGDIEGYMITFYGDKYLKELNK